MERPFDDAARLVSAYARSLERPRVLDAGCGLKRHIDLGPNAWLVGLDNDTDALEKNTSVHEKILGDVQTHPFEKESFDLAICWDVLEHVQRPQQAMRNMLSALRPGGILFLVMPNPKSLKGLVTKATPHSFHVWIYRHILGMPNAGLPGHAPFPAFLRPEIAPDALRAFAEREGLTIELLHTYEGGQMRRLGRRHPTLYKVVAGAANVLTALSFGRYNARLTDTCIVLRKPQAAVATADDARGARATA